MSKRKALALAIATAFLGACATSDPPGEPRPADQGYSARDLSQAARDCNDGGDTPQVRIDGCSVVIATQDDQTPLAIALNNRGASYLELERYDDALSDLDEAIAMKSDIAGFYVNRAEAHYGLDQHRQAIADMDQAIALDPDDPQSYFQRGLSYSRLEQYAAAVADYDRSIALDPAFVFAYQRRGMARHDLRQYRNAIEDFDRAIDLDPTDPESYQFRGYARCRLGQGSLAHDDWLQADRVGDADRRRLYQRIAIDLDYYDGPINGEATQAWLQAIAFQASTTC